MDSHTEIEKYTGRAVNKDWDWNAFTTESNNAELIRGQMRFVGSGGSSKVNDPNTLPTRSFTVSLVHTPVGRYAPAHSHECVEHFMVLEGYMTVGWVYGDEVIEARLGPGDLVLNKVGRPHGFRNDGPDPALMTITVGSGKPLPPVYTFDPEGKDPAQARAFGAGPGKTVRLDEHSSDPRHQEFARNIMRARNLKFIRTDEGWTKADYVGGDGIKPGGYTVEMVQVPAGVSSSANAIGAEDVFFVLDGALQVGWDGAGGPQTTSLGTRELVFNPPGQRKRFENASAGDVTFLRYVGSAD